MSLRPSAPPPRESAAPSLQQVLAAGESHQHLRESADVSGFFNRRRKAPQPKIVHVPDPEPRVVPKWEIQLNAGLTKEERNSEVISTGHGGKSGRRIQLLQKSRLYDGFAVPDRLKGYSDYGILDLELTQGPEIKSPLLKTAHYMGLVKLWFASFDGLRHMCTWTGLTGHEMQEELAATYQLTVSPSLGPEYLVAWRKIKGIDAWRIFAFLGTDFEEVGMDNPREWDFAKEREGTLAYRYKLGKAFGWEPAHRPFQYYVDQGRMKDNTKKKEFEKEDYSDWADRFAWTSPGGMAPPDDKKEKPSAPLPPDEKFASTSPGGMAPADDKAWKRGDVDPEHLAGAYNKFVYTGA